MINSPVRPIVGVMGSAQSNLSDDVAQSIRSLANDLGRAIAAHNCTLITGATTGFSDLISRAARSAGAVTIGVSPAQSREEHVSRYSLPDDGADIIIYPGFALTGRNIFNVLSSSIFVTFHA